MTGIDTTRHADLEAMHSEKSASGAAMPAFTIEGGIPASIEFSFFGSSG